MALLHRILTDVPVYASEFATQQTVSELEGTCSVNDYIKRALTQSTDEKLKTLLCALYDYGIAAAYAQKTIVFKSSSHIFPGIC